MQLTSIASDPFFCYYYSLEIIGWCWCSFCKTILFILSKGHYDVIQLLSRLFVGTFKGLNHIKRENNSPSFTSDLNSAKERWLAFRTDQQHNSCILGLKYCLHARSARYTWPCARVRLSGFRTQWWWGERLEKVWREISPSDKPSLSMRRRFPSCVIYTHSGLFSVDKRLPRPTLVELVIWI